MGALEALHPALTYHLVNTLEWSGLRPLQEVAMEPLARGENALLLAPTAGGKTEAALFPVLSRMLREDWRGLSVLYVCPIKALLNNLEPRLRGYAELVGRRVGIWHGDVGAAERQRLVREPPDLLLTTPESIEVLLTSRRADPRAFFAGLQVVIVDEIHAFAGDDRGWHLLAVLARAERLARLGEPAPSRSITIQRIGLSATVGNTEELLAWLTGGGPGRILRPPMPSTAAPSTAMTPPDVTLDWVGNLDNAARVISRLHRGEKRLVFCDSRARVERLALALRGLGVETHVSHSSLSRDRRQAAERAFAEGRDCVIVATSTLELGIDIGDLDRVLQIDAPPSVASFLQRLGRTGRRPGTVSNCLLLATHDAALWQTAAVLDLWREGWVEPVEPPGDPWHVFAQQLMALTLQEGGLGRADWRAWLGRVQAFDRLAADRLERIVGHMVETGILFSDEGLLGFGVEGERAFGRRHFLEVLSVLTSPPSFRVLYGRADLGTLDQSVLLLEDGARADGVLLDGRAWDVRAIDWRRRRLQVEPSRRSGKTFWLGAGRPLRHEHSAAIRRVLSNDPSSDRHPPKQHALEQHLSRRARQRLKELRLERPWLSTAPEVTVLTLMEGRGVYWWTFAGSLANHALASTLRRSTELPVRAESLALTFPGDLDLERVASRIEELRELDPAQIRPHIADKAIEALKFSACMPVEMARELLVQRATDALGLRAALQAPLRVVR